jgi:hypothetical protein
MEENLRHMLEYAGITLTPKELPHPRQLDFSALNLSPALQDIYLALGGKQREFPRRPGAWDVETADFAIELDEELHFNRYRAVTLGSSAYDDLPEFPRDTYLTYCREREGECLAVGSHGRKWTSPSSNKQFGRSERYGELDGAGSSRWRQRAFYDFMKDVSAQALGIKVVRISVWDELVVHGRKCSVEGVLVDCDPSAAEPLVGFLHERLALQP